MTLDKAIEQLQGMTPSKETLAIREAFNYEKAVRLGIEALERGKQYRYSIIIALGERIRVNDIGQAIILVGEQGIDGLVFNEWWTAFKQKLSTDKLPSETE